MDEADVVELQTWDHEHVIHPQSAPVGDACPIVFASGLGNRVYDASGREYLDATGGLWLAQVGHGRPELAEAAREQMERLEFFASFWDFTNEPAARLAKKLTDLAPDPLTGVYFTTGGAESNEIAIMMARLFHARTGGAERTVILSRHKAYHGITYAARAATGLDVYHVDVGPLPGDFIHLMAPEPYRIPDCTDACVAELEATIERVGPERIAAMIGEPIMGVGGMVVPPDDYWPRMHSVLKRHGILLIFDEVVTAYGRTGTWFGAEQWDITPDIIASAKGITSGYLPLGAVIVSDAIHRAVLADPGFVSGFTYTGHPTCCAVGLANLGLIEGENLLARARDNGEYLLNRLRGLLSHPNVGDVRGCGMMLAVELVLDKETKEPASELGGQLGARFMAETGVIARNIENTLIFSPPLTFTTEDCDAVADAVNTMLAKYGN